ncbi:MAG: hypothetical protein AAFN92_23050, partial [Bacteroidota bacterium]
RRVVAMTFTFRAKNEIELAEMRGEDISQLSLDLPAGSGAAADKDVDLMVPSTQKDQLFNRYHRDVIERFGVTPSVFMHLLDRHTEAEIEQAIGVTNRAKYNQQIKKNVAGFFVKALQDGFTDAAEEKSKKQKRSALSSALAELEERKRVAINEKIKEITARDKKIAAKAVKQLRADPITKIFITTKEDGLGRKLTLEDFRQDRALVNAVKAKIMELAKADFAELLAGFEKEQKAIQKRF